MKTKSDQPLGATPAPQPPKGFDPVRGSIKELRKFGYPPRPDPDRNPDQFARWLRYARSKRLVPKLKRTNKRHGPAGNPDFTNGTSANWSGVVITDSGNTWGQTPNYGGRIYGEFVVPSPLPPNTAPVSYCSIWIGFDGWGSPDVLQAGVQVDYSGSAQAYFWVEWFPDYEIQVTNLPVSPGDSVGVIVYHEAGSSSSQGNWAYLTNNSRNQSVGVGIQAPAGTSLVGNCIEWIVERPGVNGQLSTLAPYGAVMMQGCDANGIDGIYFPGSAPTGTIQNVSMVDNSGIAVSQAALGPPTVLHGKLLYDNISFAYSRDYGTNQLESTRKKRGVKGLGGGTTIGNP